MQPIFVRYSTQRDTPYQIKTSIIDIDGCRKVRKEPLSEEGRKHVEGIYQNALLLQKYADILKIPPFTYAGGVFEADFVSGASLDEILKAELENNHYEALPRICGKYRDILNRFPQVEVNPSDNPLFTETFGPFPRTCTCMEIGHFDLLMENVIVTADDELYSIDYEWIIDAPVPVDFIAYRAARIFYNSYASNFSGLSQEMLFEALGVHDADPVFEQMEKNFSDRIHGEKYFENQRKYYCDAPTLAGLCAGSPIKEVSTLFYSQDGQFTAEKSMQYTQPIAQHWNIEYVFREPASIRNLRWDPTETGVVMLKNMQAAVEDSEGNLQVISDFRTNAQLIEGKWCFTGDDPMVFFELGECMPVLRIIIQADMERIPYLELPNRVFRYLDSAMAKLAEARERADALGQSLALNQMISDRLDYKVKRLELRHRKSKNPVKRAARFLLKPFLIFLRPLSHPQDLPYQLASGLEQDANGLWLAQSEDPQILSFKKFKKGLYLIRWAASAKKDCILRMFPDYGSGINENTATNIGMIGKSFALHERVILLKKNAVMLRFDPGEMQNTFAVGELSYVRLYSFAAVRMGLSLIANQQGTGRKAVLLHMIKLVLTGKKSEASRTFAHALSSFGEGNKIILDDQATYQEYIDSVESEEEQPDLQRKEILAFGRKPVISVIVPVYNTDRQMLVDMIESVRNQTYENWELCLADGCSTVPDVQEVLSEYSAMDSRIRIDLLSANLGIAGNSNAALALADGEYLALLDHDDLLPPWALFEIAKAINENNQPDVLYSDEDKITFDGSERFCPHFKPDWSPDYLRSINYITHLFVLKSSLMKAVGGFLPEYDGAQDHDLILRATEKAVGIVHIPRILYHWRSHSESTAQKPGNKSYTQDAGVKAIQAHLTRTGLAGKASYDMEKGVYQVNYDLTADPLISIVIPSCDHTDDLSRCIDSITSQSTYKNYEILVVENNSKKEETFAYYKRIENAQPRVRVIRWDGPFNFSAINNFAAADTKGSILLFLNNDTEVITPDWMERMLQFAQREDVGCVGAKLYYPDGTIQHAGVVLGFQGIAAHSFCRFEGDSTGYMGRAAAAQNVSAVTAACMMLRKSIFLEINGFDETLAIAFNDIDLCMKVREAGYNNILAPAAELIHHESKSRGLEDTPEKQARFKKEIHIFRKKWGAQLDAGDPYYNPHFDLEYMPFRVSGK